MKRFTDTEKWRDPWYRELAPRLKCLWQFFCDTCDHAGVFQIDWKLASFEIGERVTAKDLEFFGERLQLLPTGRYLIKKFVRFQSGTLTESCPAHKPILKLVSNHGLVETSIGYQYPIARVLHSIEYCYPIAYPIVRVQEEEKEERKETEKKEGGVGEGLKIPDKLKSNEEFLKRWETWQSVRRAKKSCKDFQKLFQEQLNWLDGLSVPQAIESLSQSIRNDWQGLFEPKSLPVTNGVSHNGKLNGSEVVMFNGELTRIIEEMRMIKSQYMDHQTWESKDRNRFNILRTRKLELRSMLGVKA